MTQCRVTVIELSLHHAVISYCHHGLKFLAAEILVDTEVIELSYFFHSMIIKPSDEKARAASHQADHTISLHALPKTLGLYALVHTQCVKPHLVPWQHILPMRI